MQYETALKTDKFVVIAHGSADDATQAREILDRASPETLEHHQPVHQELAVSTQ